jgi:hypothetical protein
METQTETVTTPAPPYFAWKTLLNTIERMQEHGPPNRIDRSFLSNMSGAGQSQFMSGLRSLGLIDKDGVVQDALKDLVNKPDERRALIGRILRERYPEAVELGKTTATTGELMDVFRKHYGVQGDTARKAIAFYLKAARYAEDIPLSPHFKTPTVKRAAGGSATSRTTRAITAGTGASSTTDPLSTRPTMTVEVDTALAGVLMRLPAKGAGWSEERREEFKRTFGMVLDFAYPVEAPSVDEVDADEADEDFTE